LEEKDMGGYLMVYFKDQTHSAYLAISRDGRTFADINGGQPVFIGSDLAEQKGVRDPHIARGPDGAFYLTMTDLHTNGQRAGFRTTQWERPEPQYGWGNNRALVLMKSYDLVHWTLSDLRLDKAFPELAEIGCCWAPETIYDEKHGKMMVYFTMKIGRGVDNLYYAHTDEAFTKFEAKPELFFQFPVPEGPMTETVRNSLHVIDGDITKVGDKFHLFYSSKEGGTPGIEHSVSDRISAGYPVVQKRVDPETISCEAPNLFKRLGTDTYVLMYDAYGAGNMGFAETTDFVTFKDLGRFNGGVMKGTNFNAPKHGAVTHLTPDELKALKTRWHVEIALD
ncbi:MAG: glycoside hydrolase family 43 protein, partial [Verrucomicrobiota bacterium]